MTDKSTTNTNNTPQTETTEMTKPSLSKRQSSINDVDAAEILVDISTSGVAAFTGGYQDNPGDDTPEENGIEESAIEKQETTTSTTTQSSTETPMKNTLQKDTSNKLDNSSEECLNTNVSDESAVEDTSTSTTTSPTTRKVNVDMSDLVSASEKIIGPTLSGDEGTPADDAVGCEGTSPTVVKETEKVL